MRSASGIALMVLLLAGRAAAQPAAAPLSPMPVRPAPPPRDEVSETAAVWLSASGTALSWTALTLAFWGEVQSSCELDAPCSTNRLLWASLGGTFLAPSFGHWYARSFATRGLALRALGAGLFMGGALLEDACDAGCDSGRDGLLLLTGLLVYVGGTVDDLVTVRGAARRENQRFRDVALVPAVHHGGGGLAIAGRF